MDTTWAANQTGAILDFKVKRHYALNGCSPSSCSRVSLLSLLLSSKISAEAGGTLVSGENRTEEFGGVNEKEERYVVEEGIITMSPTK
jgi:hypothetical protein